MNMHCKRSNKGVTASEAKLLYKCSFASLTDILTFTYFKCKKRCNMHCTRSNKGVTVLEAKLLYKSSFPSLTDLLPHTLTDSFTNSNISKQVISFKSEASL